MQTARRFPGMAFRVETPTTVDLPRMDVAAFVGFAQRGPVQVPVVVESYPDFVNIFGGFYRLAWDSEAGLWQTACLAPAVKAFFAQGGRRCWIVRVANPVATTTIFPLAGLLQTMPNGRYDAVVAQARCPGSWADRLITRVEPLVKALGFEPLIVGPGDNPELTLVNLPQNQSLQPGDILQLDFSDRRHRAYTTLPPTIGAIAGTVTVPPDVLHWFHRLSVTQLPLTGTVHLVSATSETGPTFTTATLKGAPDEDDTVVEQALLRLTDPLAIQAGAWLRLETANQTLWLLVDEVALGQELDIASVWAVGADLATGPLTLERLQQIQLALTVQSTDEAEDNSRFTLLNLAGAAPHPRFIGYLPTDPALLAPRFGPRDVTRRHPAATLWQEVTTPRFPLAMALETGTTILPLGLDRMTAARSPQIPPGDPLVRDGLVPTMDDDLGALTGSHWAIFLPELFLDSYLRYTGQRSLLNEASDRLYLQGQSLIGIHSLITLEEISLVALPDVAHPGWRLTPVVSVTPESPDDGPERPDPCAKSGPFIPCVPPPETDSPSLLPPLPPTPTEQWQLLSALEYDETGLLEVQRAIARMAAALGDRVAVLGLPKHYRLPEVLHYQQQFLSQVRRDGETTDSYLAFYHPWLISRDDSSDLIHTEPTGANTGVMAALSLTQGAWIAPANERLQDILATVPTFALRDEQTLYSTGINPIRQTARGFVAWGSYTQSLGPEFEDLNVRRLFILLRRLALQEGRTYVFAPHSAAFRRRIQQRFERLLGRLFDRGAFAGRSPTEAFQVVLDGTLNTPVTIEQGQLIVELRVAPAQPLTFITVRLVQQETDQLTIQEVQTLGS
ncbi:MAG: hypothetical protein AAF215_22795 [Cyanobacteria bacterium P01_A01_bin.123]